MSREDRYWELTETLQTEDGKSLPAHLLTTFHDKPKPSQLREFLQGEGIEIDNKELLALLILNQVKLASSEDNLIYKLHGKYK